MLGDEVDELCPVVVMPLLDVGHNDVTYTVIMPLLEVAHKVSAADVVCVAGACDSEEAALARAI